MALRALQQLMFPILFVLFTSASTQAAPRFKAIAFDYFVLFDPDSVLPVVEEIVPGRASEFTRAWRSKQFEYGFLRSITGHHEDFFQVTGDALDYTAAAMKVDLDPAKRNRLLNAYLALNPWPDARAALERLKAAGVRIITIANFSPMMLRANADRAGLTQYFDQLLSTARNGTYKPSPQAYALGMQTLGLEKEEILFAAFGGWDAYGAKRFGYPTYWVNRFKLPSERLQSPPDRTSQDMSGLLQFVLGEAAEDGDPPGAADASGPGPDVVVAALERRSGVHPGQRRNHIKGTCAVGEFTGLPQAQRFSRSPLFSGERVPVVARFSLAGGNPAAGDNARSPRGMALEFRLAGGQLQHMTMLNTPVFGANSPQGFLDEIVAHQPDARTGKPDPEKIRRFQAAHPENQAQAEFLAGNNPPASWASATYFGIHTFKFVDSRDHETLVRWRFVPRDGERKLSEDELSTLPRDFLEARLIDRVTRGPIHWDMVVTLGEPGDPENDATRPWPAQRPEIIAGTLTITSASPQRNASCEPINFDPLIMTDGIAPSNDPVLLFRSPAYAISFGKRTSGQ